MTQEKICQFDKERNETLEQRSVNDLISFIEKWSKEKVYDIRFCESFKRAKPQVQLITLCKMILNVPTISKETQKWAIKQLKDLGASSQIGVI